MGRGLEEIWYGGNDSLMFQLWPVYSLIKVPCVFSITITFLINLFQVYLSVI